MVLEIPPQFGRELLRGDRSEVTAPVDGCLPFRGETIQHYAEGTYMTHMEGLYGTRYAGESYALSAGI